MIHITHSHPEGVYYYVIFNQAAILIGVVVAGIAAHKSKYSGREFAAIVASSPSAQAGKAERKKFAKFHT